MNNEEILKELRAGKGGIRPGHEMLVSATINRILYLLEKHIQNDELRFGHKVEHVSNNYRSIHED